MLPLRGFLPSEGCNWLATTGGLLIALPCLQAQDFSLGLADAYSDLLLQLHGTLCCEPRRPELGAVHFDAWTGPCLLSSGTNGGL